GLLETDDQRITTRYGKIRCRDRLKLDGASLPIAYAARAPVACAKSRFCAAVIRTLTRGLKTYSPAYRRKSAAFPVARASAGVCVTAGCSGTEARIASHMTSAAVTSRSRVEKEEAALAASSSPVDTAYRTSPSN